MSKILKAFSGLTEVVKRFPISVICCVATLTLSLTEIFQDSGYGEWLALLIPTFFWFGAFQVFSEARQISRWKSYIYAIASFLLLSAFYIISPNPVTYFIVLALILTAITIAPFPFKKTNDIHFYNYNRDVWLGFLYSILLGIILLIGISAILLTIKELFSVEIFNDSFEYIFQVCAILISPIFALSMVPKSFAQEDKTYIPKGIKFILSYIIVPLGLAYLLILYAYTAKILFLWELPKGDLSIYITLFGAIGSIIHLACYPLRETGNILTRLFSKYFCFSFLPLIFLLFIAVGIRIEEYGVTHSRYLLVLAGIWFLLTSINYLIKRDNYSMKFGPLLLAAMLLFSSFGPWGMLNVSASSQIDRLEKLLIKHEVLINGKITKLEKSLNHSDRKEISSIVTYLRDIEEIDRTHKWMNNPNKETDFYEVTGIEYVSKYSHSSNSNFSIYKDYDADKAHKIANNTYLFQDVSVSCYRQCNQNNQIHSVDEDSEFKFLLDNKNLIIELNEKQITSLGLEELKASAKNKEYKYHKIEGKDKITILLNNISGHTEPEFKVENINFDAIIQLGKK